MYRGEKEKSDNNTHRRVRMKGKERETVGQEISSGRLFADDSVANQSARSLSYCIDGGDKVLFDCADEDVAVGVDISEVAQESFLGINVSGVGIS